MSLSLAPARVSRTQQRVLPSGRGGVSVLKLTGRRAVAGEASPRAKQGPLAEPRSSDQTEYVISPATLTPGRVALGQKVFFEPRLSGDGTVARATCHDPDRAFTDGQSASVGIHGRVGQRNARTLLNALYNKHQFWDGGVNILEQAALKRSVLETTPFPGRQAMSLSTLLR
jgi:cytochrome c peroxidase